MRDLGDFLARNGAPATLAEVIAGVKNKDVRFRTDRILSNPVPPEQAEEMVKLRLKLSLSLEEVFRRNQIAAMIYPTAPMLPPRIRPQGDDITDTVELGGKQINQFEASLRNTHHASALGLPAVSIPAGLSSAGLPVGLSMTGLPDSDCQLLSLAQAVESALGRTPGPSLRSAPTDPGRTTVPAPRPPSAPPASAPGSAGDSVERVLMLLKRSAYLNLQGRFEAADPARAGNVSAKGLVRRFDIDFRLEGGGLGVQAVNMVGDECGGVHLKWVFQTGGSDGRAFLMDDLFVFDGDGNNRLRAAGTGRFSPGPAGIRANGNFVEGEGIFAGVQGGYVITGSYDGSRLNLLFSIRLMDADGQYQTSSDLMPVDGAPPDRGPTTIAFMGEADPEHPVELTPTGAVVHELLRPAHADFDRGRRGGSLRASTSLGPIMARWRTDVLFNPRDPNAPGTPDRPLPVKLQNLKITFLHGGATIDAGITDGKGYIMTLPGVSGPLFRMTGFGGLISGTGPCRNVRGTVSMLGAIDLIPAAFSNYYLFHIVDPDGCFR
jgi:hypothetical protein